MVFRMGTNPRDVEALTRAIADEIRAERARQRRSQREVYEAARVARSTYVRIESASRGIDMEQFVKIADALGVSPSELVRRAERAVDAAEPRHADVVEGRFGGTSAASRYSLDAAALERPTSHHDEDVAFEEQP